MTGLRLMLLGPFEARLANGTVADLSGQKNRALLAFLAIASGISHSRERLAGLLWSERGDHRARDNLKQALMRLRRSLSAADGSVLLTDRQSIGLNRAAISVDVLEFERLVADATLESLMQATALYRGDLLDGIAIHEPAFEDWLLVERQRLRQMFERALATLMAKALAAGDPDGAAEAARKLLLLDPLSEAAYRMLMQVHCDQTQSAQALKLYDGLRERLHREMGVQPEPGTVALYDRIRQRRQTSASPATGSDAAGKVAPTDAPTVGESPLPATKPGIAVLPFVNIGGDPEQQYFADGLTEDIITDLSQISALAVVARHIVFAFKDRGLDVRQAARDLDVRYVLEGRVRKAGGRVRVTAQLIDGATSDHLWAQRYDRGLDDIFALQDEISRSIADVLRVKLLPGELETITRHSTTNARAYEYYLMGRSFYLRGMDKRCLSIARDMYNKATTIDPSYAWAHAGLAICCSYVAMSDPNGSFEAGLTHSARALELDPDLAEAYAAKGLALYADGRFGEAAAEFDRAMALDPGLFEAHFFQGRNRRNQGLREDAVALFARAAELRPNDFRSPGLLAWECKSLGRREEFAAALRRCLERLEAEVKAHPDNADVLAFGSGVLVEVGQQARAADWAERAVMLGPDDPVVHYNVARTNAMLGKSDAALNWLEQAFSGSPAFRRRLAAWMAYDDEINALRDRLRFQSLIATLELGVASPARRPARPIEQASAAREASSPATRLSIAVLPFLNLSDDPEQQYFSDGITEDIITELSRFRTLFVIARNSSFRYRVGDLDVTRIGRELGVRYLAEGSVRRVGDRVRISSQLIDATTGNHLWAEHYDRDAVDILAVQDEIVRTIATTLGYRVEAAGRERALRLSPEALSAYDHVLRSEALHLRFTKNDNAEARRLAERAVELDPRSALAHAQLGWTHCMAYICGWVEDRAQALDTAYALARRAVLLDETDCRGRWLLGSVHTFRREYDEARAHLRRAIALNPNDVEARGSYGLYLIAVGEIEAALEQFDIARRHNPFEFNYMIWYRAIALFTARRYDEAIATLKQVPNPDYEVRCWLAASYAAAGRVPEARAMLAEFLAAAEREMASFPGHTLDRWEPYLHGLIEYRDREEFDHLFAALRAAGLQ